MFGLWFSVIFARVVESLKNVLRLLTVNVRVFNLGVIVATHINYRER